MSEITVYTFDWVPELPRGYVRDFRARWALEEAGLPYRVEGVSFKDRDAVHFSHQPFGQVPWMTDGDTSIFESGAMLLYLGERNDLLMPADSLGRNQVIEWLFAALNSVEMASLPWTLYKFSNDDESTPGRQVLDNFLQSRLRHMDEILAQREWLVGRFSIADIAMVDVLRLLDRFDGLAAFKHCRAYVARGSARPAFVKAYNDQMAFFAAAD